MSRLGFLVSASLLVATGCRLGPEARTATIVGGIGLGIAGAVVTTSGVVDSDRDGVNENPLDDNWGAYLAGTTMLVAGLAMLAGGLSAESREPARPMVTSPYAYAPTAYSPTFEPPSMAAARPGLPELPATAQVLRLGQQIRSATERGRCADAWLMWGQLDAQDASYAAALRAGPVMASCPR